MPRHGARDALVAAVVLKVRVEVVDPPAIGFGLNEHVGAGLATGVMLQVKLTALLNPFCGVMVMAEVADPPAVTVAGENAAAAIVKSAAAAVFTVRLIEVVWLTDPVVVPVTITLYGPAGVVAPVLMVKAELPEPPSTEVGTKAQVGAGVTTGVMLLHDSATVLVKPFAALMVIVEVADAPCTTGAGVVAAIEKSGGGFTVRLSTML